MVVVTLHHPIKKKDNWRTQSLKANIATTYRGDEMPSATEISIWNIEHKRDILEFTEKLTRYERNFSILKKFMK